MTTTTTTQPAPANTALALSGTFHDVATVGAALERAARQAHLVSPATSCGCLPEGFDLVMSTVKIDAAGETYSVAGGDDDSGGGGGKRGLSKVALDRIALAAGVSWDPVASRRLDDGRDPRYCAWLAVGRVKSLDGTEIVLQASKEIDLRDGSPQVDGLWARYKTKLARWEREGQEGVAAPLAGGAAPRATPAPPLHVRDEGAAARDPLARRPDGVLRRRAQKTVRDRPFGIHGEV